MAGTPSSSRDGGGGGLYDAYAYLRDEKAAGTEAGTFTTGARRTRTLNTVVTETQDIVTLAGNQFTLLPGTYHIAASAPAWKVARHQTWIRNITAGADALVGSSEYAADLVSDSVQTRSFVRGDITIAADTTFELQHQCGSTAANKGLGVEANLGSVEIYAEVEIWRLAD